MSGLDYEPLPPSTTLSFTSFQTSKSCVDIDILDNCTVEEMERFAVAMQRTHGLFPRIKLDTDNLLVHITDDDCKILYCMLHAVLKPVMMT